MRVLVFEALTSSYEGVGQPFAWSAAILEDHRVLAVGHWVTSLRNRDFTMNTASMAIQGYLEEDLVVRECFNDAATEFCSWLAQYHDDRVLVATSEPRVTVWPGQTILSVLRKDPARWWRPYVDHIDTRLLAWRHDLSEPPVVCNDPEPNLARRRLAASVRVLRGVPASQWLAWGPPEPDTWLHLDQYAQALD